MVMNCSSSRAPLLPPECRRCRSESVTWRDGAASSLFAVRLTTLRPPTLTDVGRLDAAHLARQFDNPIGGNAGSQYDAHCVLAIPSSPDPNIKPYNGHWGARQPEGVFHRSRCNSYREKAGQRDFSLINTRAISPPARHRCRGESVALVFTSGSGIGTSADLLRSCAHLSVHALAPETGNAAAAHACFSRIIAEHDLVTVFGIRCAVAVVGTIGVGWRKKFARYCI